MIGKLQTIVLKFQASYANFYNGKIEKYFSRFWNPSASGVDFFVQNIQAENCFVVPPVCLIVRALHYLYASTASSTVVVPFWPSAVFLASYIPNLCELYTGLSVVSRTNCIETREKQKLIVWFRQIFRRHVSISLYIRALTNIIYQSS